ncbi:MAG: hypothetical protein ACXWKS_03610, partial [Rhizomicrobium sp.]
MKRSVIVLGFAAALFAALAARAADMPTSMPMDMPGGMVMKMIDPMPSVYMGQADRPGAPIFKGLGDHHHKITTRNARTQLLFDQGIRLTFGFNHAEAIRSFREGARSGPIVDNEPLPRRGCHAVIPGEDDG